MPVGTPFGPDNPPKSPGRPPRLRACREAIEKARNPVQVTAALAEFYRRHMEEKDNDAGKVWLSYMVPGGTNEGKLDLSDAPDEVVAYLADKLN
jgi:hypothetical protein